MFIEKNEFNDALFCRYGVQLKHLNQPLLLLKQTHRPYNLLVNHFDVSKGLKVFIVSFLT